jgi:hypothetical protein
MISQLFGFCQAHDLLLCALFLLFLSALLFKCHLLNVLAEGHFAAEASDDSFERLNR